MTAFVDVLGSWVAAVFMVYVAFLAFGVNLLPGRFGLHASLALAGVVVLVGGTRMI